MGCNVPSMTTTDKNHRKDRGFTLGLILFATLLLVGLFGMQLQALLVDWLHTFIPLSVPVEYMVNMVFAVVLVFFAWTKVGPYLMRSTASHPDSKEKGQADAEG